MIRVRKFATTFARECVRSAAAARGAAGRGGGARAAVAIGGFSKSMSTSAQPPVDATTFDASTGTAAHTGDTGAFHSEQHHHGSEENAEDVGKLLRRQTQPVSELGAAR